MKKKEFLLLLLLLVPTIVFAKDTCNDNDIKIKSITLKEVNGFSEEVQESSINNNTINLNLKMYDVGDSSTYDITVENTSNEDYYFTKDSMKLENDYLEYSLKNDSETIPANSEKTIELRVTYKNKIPNDSYSDINKLMISLSDQPLKNPKTNTNYYIIFIILILLVPICIKYHKKGLLLLSITGIVSNAYALCTVNIDIETKIEIENKEAIFLPGQEVNVKMKELAGDNTSTITNGYSFQNQNIISIKHSDLEPIASNKEEKNIVSISDSPYPIYMWYEDNTIYWWSEDSHPSLNEDASFMFINMFNLDNIIGLKALDSSHVTNMSSLFQNCRQLKSIVSIENWDTSNVEKMSGLFTSNINLSNFDSIKNWNVNKVKSMDNMFSNCFNVEEIDLSNWETPSLLNMQNMFAQLWIYIDGQLTTGGVLKKIILSEKFNTSHVTNMYGTFYNNRVIENYEFLKYLDTSNVKNMLQLFYNNYGLIDTEYVKDWNVSNVENMYGLFIGTKNLISLDGLRNWNTSSATDMSYMFRNCTSLVNLSGIENWDVSNATTFNYMFDGAASLSNTSFINNWNISSSATFTRMFGSTLSHPEFTKVQGTWSNGTFTPTT